MNYALSARVRFGEFELDLKAGELHSGGQKVRLQEQPFQVLRMLVERAGEVVTREEIQNKLWPNDTVVEFDHGINTAIRKLRTALDDSAESPRYVETVARRGYRLIMPVEWAQSSSDGGGVGVPLEAAAEAAAVQPQRSVPSPGKTVSHYRVLNLIGGGGMGVVYRAEDLKLGRAVALKFIPEELGGDPVALARFEREARAASSLSHPNICTIYEVEEHEGTPFIVMEYLEGMTLRDLITQAAIASPLTKTRKPPLGVEDVLDIGLQIVDGLDAAHQKSIIHRDIKPANIFITRQRQVKILDFGLAKLITASREAGSDRLTRNGRGDPQGQPESRPETEAESNLTRAGAALGTTGYMSPEQVEGLKLDARTDLFCFGLVLYELSTGQRAFSGSTKDAYREAVLHQSPVPVRELNPAVSPRLEAVVNRCLEKDRNQRYQHASDVREELKQVRHEWSGLTAPKNAVAERIAQAQAEAENKVLPPAPDPAAPRRADRGPSMRWLLVVVVVAAVLAAGIRTVYRSFHPSSVEANATIAVLPFADMSPGHDEEYFSDGLTEQLINDLTRIPGLNVIARSSAFQFKGKTVDPRTVGRTLNVANVLEGSVRKEGNRVRITVELTKASDGFQLWSESYDRSIGDIFAVQDEIARSVAGELRLKLIGTNGSPYARTATTTTPEAYQAYLEGNYFARRNEPGDYEKALAYVNEALKLDPKYAPAWALRANVLGTMAGQADANEIQAAYGKARESAQAAIGLDPTLATPYLALARIQLYYDFDTPAAVVNLSKAAELEPGNADVYRLRAKVAQNSGRLDEAVQLEKKALALDPLGHGNLDLGNTLYLRGQYDQAQAALEKALDLNPRLRFVHFIRGQILLAQDHPDQALAEFRQESWEAFQLLGESLAYYAAGHVRESDEALNELIAKHQQDSAYQIAEAYAYRNQIDPAFAWLDRAYRQHDGALQNLRTDPLLKNLHPDPRYRDLLAKMRL